MKCSASLLTTGSLSTALVLIGQLYSHDGTLGSPGSPIEHFDQFESAIPITECVIANDSGVVTSGHEKINEDTRLLPQLVHGTVNDSSNDPLVDGCPIHLKDEKTQS